MPSATASPALPSGVQLKTATSFDSHAFLPSTLTDASNNTATTLTYDSMLRLSSTVYQDGGGKTTSFSHNPVIVATTVRASPNPQQSSSVTLDGLGRPSKAVAASGASTESTYDARGRLSTQTNPHDGTARSSDGSTTYSYDGIGRRTSETKIPNATSKRWAYSANTVTITDEQSSVWAQTLDAFGRLTQITEPGGLVTNYGYDILGNLTSVTQRGAAGDSVRTRAFTYDMLSRLLTASNPETGTICYGVWSSSSCINGYDGNGNLLAKTDARSVVTSYSYDALNRMLSKTYSDGTRGQYFGYDGFYDDGSTQLPSPYNQNAKGRMTQSSDRTNVASHYGYDTMGRLNQKADCFPLNCSYNDVQQATYDQAGNLATFTYPDGRKIQNATDDGGRFQGVSYQSWNGNGHSYTYASVPSGSFDPAGHVLGMLYGNGLGMAAAFDSRQRVQDLAYGSTQQLLWGRQYAWTPNSNLNYTTDMLNGVQRQFAYDNLNRLTAAQDT